SSATPGRTICRARRTSWRTGCLPSPAATTTSRPGSARVRATSSRRACTGRPTARRPRPPALRRNRVSLFRSQRRSTPGRGLIVTGLVALLVFAKASLASPELGAALERLGTAKTYEDRLLAARSIAESGHPDALALLGDLLEGRLYTLRSDGRVVVAASIDR